MIYNCNFKLCLYMCSSASVFISTFAFILIKTFYKTLTLLHIPTLYLPVYWLMRSDKLILILPHTNVPYNIHLHNKVVCLLYSVTPIERASLLCL